MAESSPGDHGSRKSSATVVDGTSSHSQPSSLPLNEDHFGSTAPSDHPSVYANKFINGLQFRTRRSQEKCPSFTYASVPGVAPTPIEWKTCCDPDSDVGSEHVTYHVLTGSDKSLSEVIDRYVESNVVGLIIINSTDSVFLSNDFKGRYVPQTPPVYIISSGDGEQLIKFIRAHDEGFVQVKVLVESAVDSRSALTVGATSTLSNKGDSKMDLPVTFNFHKELEKILRVYKKEKIYACSDCPEFHFAISCFRNYEAQTKRESPDKAIKALDSFTDETFNKDFLFYLLFAYRIITRSDVYGTGNVMNSYLIHCIEKFEALNDVQAMANVILIFVQSGDFTVQFSHGSKNDVSMFQLLYHMTTLMLGRSTRLQEEKVKANKVIVNTIYRRILWISMIIYFGLKVNIEISTLASLWETHLLNQRIQRELACSDDIVKEFAKGFEVMKALQLPESVWFDYSELGTFFHPLKMQILYISHVMKLINAGQSYLNWDLTFLCQFLPPFKHNYVIFFKTIKKDWKNYSKEGTKIAVYKEILRFLESILDCILKNNEDKTMADVIETEIAKWIELLVNNINMFADNAVLYLRVLRSHVKLDKRIIGASIRARGMEIVTKLTLPQFYTLFNDLQLWTFEFVEKFLNNYDVPASVDLKDSTWKCLLEEIINRFSRVHCRICIVGLLERINKTYKTSKKQSTFVMDLMKLDTPDLFLVQSPKEDDPKVDKLFIGMVRTFIQKNTLREIILSQIPSIMALVNPDSHLHSLILAVLQKEAVPDSKMIEKLSSGNHLKLLVNAGVKAASASLTKLPPSSEVDKFYWHFVASCCTHVQPSVENLSKLKTYLFVIDRLSTIFHDYCTTRKIEKPAVIHSLPQEIDGCPNTDVKDYFKWMIKMQSIVIHWESKFRNEEFNYDDIFTYASNLQSITVFAKCVDTSHLVLSNNEIGKFKENYSAHYGDFCSLLLKSNREYGWCTMVDILNFYGIKLSHTLQTKLDTHLVLPGKNLGITVDNVQQRLNQPNGQLELEPEMILLLKKSMTWKMLKEIFNDLRSFLEPIASQLEFLVYFHMHNCEMFSKHLKSHIAKISAANSDQPVEERDIILAIPIVSAQQSSTDPDKKLLQFAAALKDTREFILSLINGTATYAEIFAEGSLEESIQKFDAESEFRIMCGFPEFQAISAAHEEGKEGIKHMLELFQYSHQISKIPEVCLQYHLEQCLRDPKLKNLEEIVKSVQTPEDRAKVTGQIANNHMKKIWEVLSFADPSIAKRCLKIFPAVANCAEFYQFIQKKGFANDRAAFSSQLELITAQLQHEDYNETVLNHLMPAFQYIAPFLDQEQSLGELMNKITKLCNDGVGFGRDSRKDFCQLETVNSNVTMIQLWFSRTEGDTLENVSTELDCIMETGCFKLVVKPKRIAGTTRMEYEAAPEHNSGVHLHYEPTMTSFLQRRRLQTLSESHDEVSLPLTPPPVGRQFSCVAETWNNEQIDDFVRKLGFLEAQSIDVEQKVKLFQQLSQTAQKFYQTLLKLRDLGHPEYVETTETINCSDKLESVEAAESKVIKAEEKLKSWNATIRNMHNSYDKLLFFSVSKVLSLYDILSSPNFSIDEMIQEVGFLFENDPGAIKKLKTAIKGSISDADNTLSFSKETTPVAHVGRFLVKLCGDISVAEHFLYSRSQPSTSIVGKSLLSFQEIVHFAPNYDNGQLLRLLIQIYNGVPESFEVFQCDENSAEEDLKLFLGRASKFRYRTFTILGVDALPYKLQEIILHHHAQEAEQSLESAIRLNYIETATSILHEMPWVVVKEYKENGPDLKWDAAKHICSKCVNKRSVNFELILVYGHAGDGKTHYVKKQLQGAQHSLVIAVNESFSPLNAILKLRSLTRDESCSIFFNFTIVPSIISKMPEEQIKYKKLMNTLAWFFFKLLVFEYVEDSETGMAFRLPGGHKWKIFIEVPSLSEVTKGNAEQHLEWICNEIPIFKLLGKPVIVEKEKPYDISPSVQLVCKYLRAYKYRDDLKKGINRLYIDNGPPVNFGDDPNLSDEDCHSLLREYMPKHVTKNKVLQQLFIKYMERRCKFMESFPGFCFNSGCGTLYAHKHVDPYELKKMVNDRVLVKLQGRYYSNTSSLGQVLMATMLKEVSEFCKINIQQSWATQAHQQLIYEVRSGAGTIQLLTLKPEELNEEITRKFEVLGIEIPDMKQLRGREKLDGYLSSALGVPLKDGRLQDIDEAKYVLTLDYTVKMLNIHERRECGIPVIIEGETGVGKTALINMLSKLWNHALISQWRGVKGRIIDMLHHKSLDMDNTDLQHTLEQLGNEWQFDKDSEVTDKVLSEEELLPLTEMTHSLQEGDSIPFYECINRRLLEMSNSESILGLLDVDVETKDEQYRDRLLSFSNRKASAVSYLIESEMYSPSAQGTAKLLCKLLNGNLVPTFYKLNIHAALSPKKIQEFFIPIVKLAKHLLKIHKAKQIKGMNEPPVVTVFLDEVNTSSCMGLFKEIIIDKTFEGEPLPPNIFLVAACNPHRGNSLAVHENKDEHKAETWVRGSYYVQKLHPTLQFLMWDYGSLNHEQEAAYVQSKMIMVNEDFDIVQNVVFSELVVKCQNLIRHFAYQQLKCFKIEDKEAKLRATSCVSQRDIQRVFTFYNWISKTYEILQEPSTEGGGLCISEHPMINERLNREEMRQRALLVALGLVYYMRLDSEYREQFSKELDKMHFAVKFQTAFTQEMDFYTNELSLPTGIAKTEALKENLFATIICTVTKTPLIIVGAPGSSKTLSFNLTISNLKGPESKQKLFRNTEVFKSLDPHYYQCSRRTTSTEIETVFLRAINRQRSHTIFSMPIRCVVFMDEAGLPEESHESLKVLHYHLDQQEVAFVAITNHILDAAKTNRAVSLFRPTASQKDLETLAKGCLCANPERPPPELEGNLRTIVKFCPAYYAIMQDKRFEKFFGLRDFIHFINYIRREQAVDITPELVLQSLERNFNGTTKGFDHICSIFLEKVGAALKGLKQRSIIEILRNSLADKPYVSQTTTNKVMASSLDDTQNEVRYKLIIDPSEDESITRLLFMFDILKRDNTRSYMCSDFLGDGQLQKINTIAAIRHSAIAGHTVIMSQTDDIHESFYDLFNQHFRRIDDPEGGPRYFTNIAIGAHLKPSRVDQNFQCIVVVKESEIKNTPAPFLNRFEKYYISHTNLLNLVLKELPPCLKVIINVVYKKVETFYSLLDESSFYGGNKETVCSLLLSILPEPGHKYKPITQSFVPTDSEGDDGSFTGGSFSVIKEGSSNKVLLLQNVVRCLHELGGFCYMESSQKELEHDANCIIDLLAKAGSEFSGVAETLGSCNVDKILQWITEAMDLIYTGEGPPDIDTPDYNMCGGDDDDDDDDDDNDNFKTLGASDGACMVTAVIAQWLVRYLCKKLMQLMTPEAAILKRKSIPISYLETYLNYQTHFSIKELITRQSELLNQCGDGTIATKLICYTRSTPSIHQLPAMYPRTTFSSAEELQQSNGHVEHLICDKADNVFLCKLSAISSQTAFKLQLHAFEASQRQNVFVLIINMQDTSRLIINHIRIMIEEAERTKTEIKKLFVLLLHFPAMMFYEPCYPSLFLQGWNHYYLDAIDRTNISTLVDTREWFRQSCLTVKEVSAPTAAEEIQSLLALLKKQESILVIASRILLNIDSNEVSLDSQPDVRTKASYLKKLLFDKKVAHVLCLKFKSYWRSSVMGDHLEQAAKFSKSRESTLNVSDSVDSIYRSSFFNFIAFMIYQMSRGRNLDMLFSDYCDNAVLDLFLKLLDVHPIPKLSEIKAFNNTWDCRVHTAGKTGYIPQFPFFVEISAYICNMVEQSVGEINKSDDILQEKAKPDIIDLQSKEQMLNKLYEHLHDKSSAVIKAKKTVGEKYMSAIAIKEMGNDEALWQKYFNDFTHQHLHLTATAPDNIENKLVQLTFTDVLRKYSVMKAIAVHCYMFLYQLDLAKIVASLKPLGQLEELKGNEQSLYPGDPQSSLLTTIETSKSALGSSSVSKFVIDSLFSVLVNVIYSKDKSKRLSLLQKWYNSYRDMMSMASLKSMLTVAMLTDRLKTQHHLMKVTFLVLQSFHHITNVAAECACTFASYLCNKCFDEKFQFKGDVSLNLKEIVTSFHIMLQSPQFTKVVTMSQLYQHIMEGLFAHFFPDTGNSKAVYSKEDIKFFLTFANEQDKQKAYSQMLSQDDQSANSISLSKFKFHLDRILCKGWSKSEIVAKPLTFYKLEVCICVGETILSQHPETSLSKYIPLYLQQATKTDHLKLMHLYFYTVLERLHTSQFTPTQLLKMVTDTEKKLTEASCSKAENLMAVVERQALLEALLQSIVNDFDLENKTKLTKLSTIADQINDLVNEQSHYDILLMYLMKKHHGVQGVLNVLAEKHRKLWEPLICLKTIKEKLKGSPPSTVHQFPFIVGGPTTEHQFNIIYRDLCTHLHGITPPGSSTERAKTFVLSIVNSSDESYDGKSVVRMMIWLCVYYEFYCKKRQGTNLMKFFKEMERDLEFAKERLNVLNCFLDCKNMKKVEEVPNPLDPNAEVLEYTKDGKIRPKQPPSNAPKSDPIWELFNPKGAREDPSDVDLRNALANMIAVVFGLPGYSTHLWYHMFTPGDLENSYMTGFMYPKVVKRGTLMYDCGCELNEDGNFGRSDYSSRDTLSLHSWYLLLWCNFGAFCIGLLTQPTALEQLKGRILSDWMSIRHYCMTQLRTVWLHMRTNMTFGDEERSFFIMSSMYRLFMLFQQEAFPHPKGKFGELSALADYEKAWHKLVYEFSKTDLKNKLENHSSHSVWALPILKTFRALEQHYPHPATESDYMNSLVDATEANDCSYTHVYALHQFTLEQRRLQVGGALLPDLVEFYQWIHTQLSHLVTYQRAKQITVGNVISLTAKRYSQELCDNLTKLFKRIIDKFNDYLRVTGGVVGGATCNRAVKPTDVHPISKDTPLIYLVSLEDTNKNDWLYLVLMDVMGNHNAFLNNIFAHALHSDCHYKKYLPDNPPELHLAEVTDQSCIVPADGPDGKQFLKLINSHYVYNVIQSSAMFDLVQLEQDVVKFYIAGKPLIAIDDGIRTVFRFRNSPTENTLPGNNPGCATDLSAIAQELPINYKESLCEGTKKNLEFHFRMATYHTFTEVVDGLRTVMGHLIQGILQRKDKAWDPTVNTKLFDYLKTFFSKDHHKVFDEVGIQSIDDTQCKLLGDIEMKRLFKCLGLFVGWLQGGLYDFSSLPVSFLKHLNHEDLDTVMKLHSKYSSTGMDRLLTELDEFEKTLNHAENHLTTVVEHKSSIIQCLVELGLCDAADKFVSLIPKSILVCHYVHFRMALRKLKLSVTAMTHTQAQNSEAEKKWTEIIEDLWKHLPHFQDEEELYDDHCLKFDCVALQFGDGEESDSDSETWPHQNTSDMEDSFAEVETEELIEKIKQNPELKKAVLETLAPGPVTPSLATASVTATSVVPSSLMVVPSTKAMAMSTEELCQWLKDRNVADHYIECFREDKIDGKELAAYDDNDLKDLGISEPRIRKKIMIQFRNIS